MPRIKPRPPTMDEQRSAVYAVLKLGEFFNPAATYQVLDAAGLLDTAHEIQAENHARRTA
jgi:hypothetical protein